MDSRLIRSAPSQGRTSCLRLPKPPRRLGFVVCAILAPALGALSAAASQESQRISALLRDPSAEEWNSLSQFDGTLTRSDFEARLNRVFDPTAGLRPYLAVNDGACEVFSSPKHDAPPVATIRFSPPFQHSRSPSVPFRSPAQFRARKMTPGKPPLDGLRIAIEPADIGGKWAKLEDRSVFFAGYGQVNEGDLNLAVARHLSADLTRLGASVFLARNGSEPVCALQVRDVEPITREVLKDRPWLVPEAYFIRYPTPGKMDSAQVEFAAGLLLTKTLETRARAEIVRRSFKPDLTIVLQHNATPGSNEGRLAPANRNIFFVEGAYTQSELKEPEQRFRILMKVLQNVTPIEVQVASTISARFKERTGFLPVLYGNSANTVLVSPQNPYVVARNLAFNREHDGPVVVTEPYFMNQADTLARIRAGDYDGLRVVAGRHEVSIAREYAGLVADGIAQAYH